MKKVYIILSVVLLIILIIVAGFFIKERYINKEHIAIINEITGEKENILAGIDNRIELTDVSTSKFYKKNKTKIFLYGVKNVSFEIGENVIDLLNNGNLSINILDYILYREVTENKANFEKCEFSDFYEFDNFYVINYWWGKNSICFVSKDLIKKDVIKSRTDEFLLEIQEKY